MSGVDVLTGTAAGRHNEHFFSALLTVFQWLQPPHERPAGMWLPLARSVE